MNKSKVKILIAQDQIKKAFDLLLVLIEEEEQHRTLIALFSRYSNLKRNFQNELIAWEQFVISRNKIIESLLDIVEELSDEQAPPQQSIDLPSTNKTKGSLTIYFPEEPEEAPPLFVEQKPRRRLLATRLMATAAVFLLVAAVGVYFWSSSVTYSHSSDQLFAAYYDSFEYPMSRDAFSPSAKGEVNFSEAKRAFNHRQYDICQRFLEENLESHISLKPDIQFMSACVFLETKQTERAVDKLEELLTLKDYIFTDIVEWYLALAYLKNEEVEKCERQLEYIINDPQHSHHEKARRLFRDLKYPLISGAIDY